MTKLIVLARVLLGLPFLVFGLDHFLHFMPPQEPPPELLDFTQGLASAAYFMPLLKGTEVVCGALLLAGLFVPLALTVLAPILINIVCVHLFMAPEGLPIAGVLLALELFLAFAYRAQFSGVLAPRAGPGRGKD